jgi:hypothetical protein
LPARSEDHSGGRNSLALFAVKKLTAKEIQSLPDGSQVFRPSDRYHPGGQRPQRNSMGISHVLQARLPG